MYVCLKLFLFAACTVLRACVHTCLRRVGLGGERKWGRDGDHQSSTDHDPAYRSFLFFPPLFSRKVCICVAVSPPSALCKCVEA